MRLISNITQKLCVLIPLFCALSAAHAVELMKWERMPLAVPLHVGQERVIFVDSNVRVGVPSSLTGKLRIQSTGGTLYLMALEPIAPTRIQLQDAQTGALILMDIAATVAQENTSPLEPVQIIEGDHTPVRYGRPQQGQQAGAVSAAMADTQLQSSNQPSTASSQRQRETPVPVVLTRYAAQNLYAPLRTVEPVTGIARVNLNGGINLKTLLPMLPVKARALASWRLEDYWVSAVSLQNTSNQTLTLDPRWLQGDFVAATFQHLNLGPAGDSTDTTVVYLVTRKHGLAESLLPAVSRINAVRHINSISHTNVNAGGQQNEK